MTTQLHSDNATNNGAPTRPYTLERRGLGYVMTCGWIQMSVGRLRESGGDLKAHLRVVRLYRAGPKNGETIYRGSFNLSTDRTRSTMAGYLSKRMATDPATGDAIRWDGLVEIFCTAVLDAEEEQLTVLKVGSGPVDEEPDTLVGPFLIPGEITLLYAPGGAGKSTFAAFLAVAMETGAELIPGWRVPYNAPVLILDFEDRPRTWHRRIRAITRGAGLADIEIHYQRVRGRLSDHLETIANYITEFGIGLVIVDSVEAAAGVGDGDGWNDRVARLWGAVGQLGVTALLVDHLDKVGARFDEADALPFGGVFKTNWSRQTWRLQRLTESDGTAEILLVNRKVNDGPKAAPINLSVTYGHESIRFTHSRVVRAPVPVKAPSQSLQVLEAFDAFGPFTVPELATKLGIKDNQIRTILGRLKDAGKTVDLPTGHWDRKR